MAKKANLIEKISPNKWIQRVFIVIISLVMSFGLAFVSAPPSLGIIPTALILSFITIYMIYLIFGDLIKRISSILSNNWKKIANVKVFFGWFVSLYLWLVIGAWLSLKINSIVFSEFWVYSIFVLLIVYPCIISLAVYLPSFQYLWKSKDDYVQKKNIVNTLIIMTVSLATPWIFLLLLFSSVSLPIWVNYLVVLAVYITIFFLAIDLPYYLSKEDTKKRKVKGLTLVRESLVEKLCNINDLTERVAVELNIERIDREIEKINSESSHPYLFLKPIAGFLVVSILANLLVEIIKVGLHL